MFDLSTLELFTSAPLLGASRVWYSVPLIISISLVYGATRHESMPQILDHAVRFGLQTIGFLMLVVGSIAVLLSWLV